MNPIMCNIMAANLEAGELIYVLKIVIVVIMALCALFIIGVVLFQPGNSSGIGALGGTTETFLGKNKSKTFESKMKKITVVSSVILAVLSIAFYVLNLL